MGPGITLRAGAGAGRKDPVRAPAQMPTGQGEDEVARRGRQQRPKLAATVIANAIAKAVTVRRFETRYMASAQSR